MTTSEELTLWPAYITRSFSIDDASVRSGHAVCQTCGQDATGRLVDAYAAVFNEPTEIRDDNGWYIEELDRSAFNRTVEQIQRSNVGLRAVSVFFNHGETIYGTPSEQGSRPLGHPSHIAPDGRGLLTTTHYGRSAYAEEILQDVRDGNLSGQSFTGRIIRSDPERVPRVRRGSDPPHVWRRELGLKEYGPTPLPYYAGAQMLAVRSQNSPDQHSDNRPADSVPPPQNDSESGAEDSHSVHSGRYEYARRIAIRRAHGWSAVSAKANETTGD